MNLMILIFFLENMKLQKIQASLLNVNDWLELSWGYPWDAAHVLLVTAPTAPKSAAFLGPCSFGDKSTALLGMYILWKIFFLQNYNNKMQIDCHYMKTYLGGIIKSFTIRVNPNSFPAEELIGILVIPFYRWEIGDQKWGGGELAYDNTIGSDSQEYAWNAGNPSSVPGLGSSPGEGNV